MVFKDGGGKSLSGVPAKKHTARICSPLNGFFWFIMVMDSYGLVWIDNIWNEYLIINDVHYCFKN